MKKTIVRVTQTRSTIGETKRHRATMRALGLRKINQIVEQKDTPTLQGMLRKVAHLVKVT